MDTRSSSGSGSNSTNPNNHRPGAAQQATYTTAGTVYNPQTVLPLQPPARRGRAARWPPAVPADLASFNSSVAGGLPRPRYRSPPTTASTLKHYTPLQQNHDRAVDPTHFTPSSLPNPTRTTSGSSTMSLSSALPRQLLSDEQPKPILCNECGQQFQTVESANFHIRVTGHDSFTERAVDPVEDNIRPDGEALLQADDEKEEERLAQFSHCSVKTLTNLASFPNPNQMRAQKCLDRARETFKPESESSRPASRSSSRPGFDGVGGSASSYFGGSGHDSSMFYSRVPRNLHMTSSTRSSVLSNGPGAPQPLTAGPPGQRQYKASTLEGPLRALKESAQNPLSADMAESLFGTNPPSSSVLADYGRQPSAKVFEPPRPVLQELDALGFTSGFDTLRSAEEIQFGESMQPQQLNIKEPRWTRNIRETKAPNEVSGYYGGDPPRDYNAPGFVPFDGDNSDLQPLRRSLPGSTDVRSEKANLDHHRAMFYAGANAIFKPFEKRYQEIRDEARDREQGLIDPTERGLTVAQMDAVVDASQLGKPRDISIDVINRLQRSDVARFLLGMTCTTLYDVKKGFEGNPEPHRPESSVPYEFGAIGQESTAKVAAQANQVLSRNRAQMHRFLPRTNRHY